jgi:asparagine synthase (glutamine-hydrolysing)
VIHIPGATTRRQIRLWSRHPHAARAVGAARRERLTYLSRPALLDLADATLEVEARGVPGAIVEAGCALGGSILVLASAKARARPLLVFDTFGMIPEPGASDGADVHERYSVIASGRATGLGTDQYYGYRSDLQQSVGDMLGAHGYAPDTHSIRLVPGLFQDTMHFDCPVAFAHIDCDWHDSVQTCLERIGPNLVEGGVMVIDDYDTYSGCKLAVDEYLDAHPGEFVAARRARLHLTRTRAGGGP